MEYLTTDEILTADDLGTEDVPVPEWGEGKGVQIQGISKGTQQSIRSAAMRVNPQTQESEVDTERLELLMFIHCVAQPKFDESAYDGLRAKSAAGIDRVLKRVMALNGMSEDDRKETEARFLDGAEVGTDGPADSGQDQ